MMIFLLTPVIRCPVLLREVVTSRIEHMKLLIRQNVVRVVLVTNPCDIGSLGGQPDGVGADKNHSYRHNGKKWLQRHVVPQRVHSQPLKSEPTLGRW